ncbi:MAG TPA: PKD domain-containing protein [Solirubrobacteraceae bacterium]|nr:PKD domain-containing protein [Solirubrobacteraceae bacterium]
MALRRELLLILLVAALMLVAPSQAAAAPQWLGAEPLAPAGVAGAAPDVAADADGGSAAAWTAGGHVYVAQRPRRGPWGPADDLAPAGDADSRTPQVTILPGGELVALWEVGFDVLAARKPPGGDWSAPQPISSSCCVVLRELLAGADGTAVGFWTSTDDDAQTAVKPPGAASFEPAQDIPLSSFLDPPTDIALAPDGSVVVVGPDICSEQTCIAGARHSGGAWGAVEPIAIVGTVPSGVAVTANADSTFTAVWTEPNLVRSSDRASGGGGWDAVPEVVANLPGATAGCTGAEDCVDVAVGPQGQHVAVWGQRGPSDDRVAAALRPQGGGWGPNELVALTDGRDASPRTAFTSAGIPVVTGAGAGPAGTLARAAHRTGPGAWTVDELGAALAGTTHLGTVAADGDGDAVTAWADPSGASAAGFDGAGPRFSAFSLPSSSSVGPALFSAAADDNWAGLASISWQFGDGGSAFGGAVSHAYGAAGTFTASATATDAVGNATQESGSVVVTPAPDPCGTADTDRDGIENGCDESNGAERPRPFRTVNATVVSGEVFVKLPAGSASASQVRPPRGFVRLEGAETIPVGATLDTLRGRVKIRSAANTRRKTQTGQFFRGRFVIRQARIKRRSRTLITDMRLTGTSFRSRCGTTASVSQRRRRSKRRVRRLFGDAKGTFRTSGRNAAATVRGTRWGVQDRCDGTLVAVQRGRVEVRDKVKRKTIILRRGKTYLARAR